MLVSVHNSVLFPPYFLSCLQWYSLTQLEASGYVFANRPIIYILFLVKILNFLLSTLNKQIESESLHVIVLQKIKLVFAVLFVVINYVSCLNYCEMGQAALKLKAKLVKIY